VSEKPTPSDPKFKTIAGLKPLFAEFFDPMPCDYTIRQFLLRKRVPFIKSNPSAKRGGGPCFFNVCATEEALRSLAGVWTEPRRRAASQQEGETK
jgi:hypothetical protein